MSDSAKPKIALCMIAKDKADIIVRALDSTKKVFDQYCLQDTGSIDNTVKIFTKWCKDNNKDYSISEKKVGVDYKEIIVDDKKILAEFGKARNDSFTLVNKDIDFAFWIDTDDTLINAEFIPALAEYANNAGIHQIIMEYIYAQSPDGVKPLTQGRERLLDLRKKGAWVNRVHEHYEYKESIVSEFMENINLPPIVIQHERSPIESISTNRRNHLIMAQQIKEEEIKKVSAELLGHMAYDHWEHAEWDDAIKYYKIILKRAETTPTHVEQIYQVLVKLARCYMQKNKPDDAFDYALKASNMNPNVADAYTIIAEIHTNMGRWEEASFYADKILRIGKPQTTAPINEYEYLVNPYLVKINAALQLKQLDTAIGLAKELYSNVPNNPQLKQRYLDLVKAKKAENVLKAIGELSLYWQENNKVENFALAIKSVPIEMLDQPLVQAKIRELRYDFYSKTFKYDLTGKPKTIVIYAGQHYEDWDGNSDITKGIGGSEGMCIQMARALAKLGNKVTVFNECGDSNMKTLDGVLYVHHSKWNAAIECDIFVSLRRPDVFKDFIRAKKKYLWLHDTYYGEQPMLNFMAPNKVIILTDFHKEIIKESHNITDDSIFWQTRNSINQSTLEYADKNAGERNPYQIIWASSYDRGLDNFLKAWTKVKAEVPEASAKIFYGWDGYDKMMEARRHQAPQWAAQMEHYKSNIIEMVARSKDVYMGGRISQNELYKEFAESGVWYYPTTFEEISCITAMQAQALGAIPVCTSYAALNETVNSKFGYKTDVDKTVDALIYLLKNSKEKWVDRRRTKMMKWARKEYNIDSLAKEWDEFFNID